MRPSFGILGLTLVALLMPSTPAEAYPRTDRTGETTLVGKRAKGTPRGDSVGTWNVTARSISTRVKRARRVHLWWSTDPAAEIADGFVRARIEVEERFNSVLLLRHTPSKKTKDPEAHSGYGVELGKHGMKLFRYDGGVSRSLSQRVRFPKQLAVELVAFMVGPNISVTAYSGDTLRPLGTLVASDRKYAKGSVGLRMYGRRVGENVLTLLTVRKAFKQGAVDQAPPSSGAKRYLELAKVDYDALARELRAELPVMKAIDLKPGRVLVRAYAPDHEQLDRLGVDYVWRDQGTPFVWKSRRYREQIGKAVEATPTGFRIDQSYKDHQMVEALLQAYAKRFPKLTKLMSIGKTGGGRDIWALKISDNPRNDEDEPAVMLNGSHHGNELLPVEFVMDAVQHLLENYGRDPAVTRWVDELELWLVPLVNPDGNWSFMRQSAWSGRKNVRDTDDNGRFDYTDGVDLNRNYPFRWGHLGELGSHSNRRLYWYRGPHPGSEPETQTMMRLTDSEHFVASISYHTVSTVILAPYTTNRVTQPRFHAARRVAEDIAAKVPKQPNGRKMKVKKQIYAVDGVDQDHFKAAHGTTALLVEGAYHNPGYSRRLRTVRATRPTWTALLDRVLDGPMLSGRVTDPKGNPVAAQVVIWENRPRMGEIWTSRCRDGRYDKLLPKGGKTLTVKVQAPGYKEKSLTVEAAKVGVTRLDITLEAIAGQATVRQSKLCGDPALLSPDHYCACKRGQCVDLSKGPQWCVRDGVCHPLGTPICRPDAAVSP